MVVNAMASFPLRGTWIEIDKIKKPDQKMIVVPFAGNVD